MPDRPSETPTTDADCDLFAAIAKDIKSRPDSYREAGAWLDREYGNAAINARRKRRVHETLEEWKDRRGRYRMAQGSKGSKPFDGDYIPLARLSKAMQFYLSNPPTFPDATEATRILLITWLHTDAEADKANLGLTELENWPWGSEAVQRKDDSAQLFRRFASEHWEQAFPDKWRTWIALAGRAWRKLQPTQARLTPCAERVLAYLKPRTAWKTQGEIQQGVKTPTRGSYHLNSIKKALQELCEYGRIVHHGEKERGGYRYAKTAGPPPSPRA